MDNNNFEQPYPQQPYPAQPYPQQPFPVSEEDLKWPPLPYKYCPARAIVSLALGIGAALFGFFGPVFVVFGIVFSSLARASSYMQASMTPMSITYDVMGILYALIAIPLGIISLYQGKKYFELYHRPGSRMVKGGKIASIIGFVFTGITLVGGIIALVIIIANFKFF